MAETRITAGEWRGRAISTPRGLPFRPTRSLVREALFNILGTEVDEARLVDLYAGAGTVGFEALSRGAAHVTFVDNQRESLALIASTAQRFGCASRCTLVRSGVVPWLRGGGRAAIAQADICFLDAPYSDDSVDEALRLLGAAPPPLVVCEHHRERRIDDRYGELATVRRARYGITGLSFLRRADDE